MSFCVCGIPGYGFQIMLSFPLLRSPYFTSSSMP